MLNGLWLGFFLVVVVSVLVCWLIGGDVMVFVVMVESLFVMVKLVVEVMVLLFGILMFWFGFLCIVEKVGLVECLVVLFGLLFCWLMLEVLLGYLVIGLIILNFVVNGLGLDNVVMLIGLKVMKVLQEFNFSSIIVSNVQIFFLVFNVLFLILLLVIIFMYCVQQGVVDLILVFLLIFLVISVLILVGLLLVVLMQCLCLWDLVVLVYLIFGVLLLVGFMVVFGMFLVIVLVQLFLLLGNLMLFSLIVLFLIVGVLKKVLVYESFVEGVKEGFDVVRNLLLYLVVMFCVVGVLCVFGVLEVVFGGICWVVEGLGWDSCFVEVLFIVLVKLFFGSVVWVMLLEIMQIYGVDSFLVLVVVIVQGSIEIIFYVFVVYFGLVGLQCVCYVVGCVLIVDLVGVIVFIVVCYWFFV